MTRNYTFSGHFWEHQNNNGVVTLVNRMRTGKQTCENLKAAYGIRVSSEENHANALLQMANSLQTCEESGHLGQVLSTTQEQWTLLANAHLQTAKDLNSAVIQPLSAILTKQKQLRRELQANVTKFYNNRQLQTHCVLRARDRYNAECTKANEIMQQSSGKEKNLTYKRANAVIKKFQHAYDNSMDDLKMVTEEWNKQWQYTCEEFELLEEERMTFLQTNIYTCNDLLSRTLDDSAEAYEKIASAVDLMDVDADLDEFIQTRGGTETIPDAMDYIKLYVLQETTKSQDNDDDPKDAATTADSTHTSTAMNDESYATLETKDKTPIDTTDSNNNVASLMVGRMEMYNSDDDNFTDSDYDDDNDDDGDYDDGDSDYGYEHDEPIDDATTDSRCDESQDYVVENDGHQQGDHPEVYGKFDGHIHHQHSKYHYDHDYQRDDLIHHDNDTSKTSTSGIMDAGGRSDLAVIEDKAPLDGLGIEATHGKLPQGDVIDELEYRGQKHMDKYSVQQHKYSGTNSLECDGQTTDHSNIDDAQESRVVDYHSSTISQQQQKSDKVTNATMEQQFNHQPSSTNTHHLENDNHRSSSDRYNVRQQQQQQPPPPVPEHHYNPTPTMDNDCTISTPASPSSIRVNEELDNMLRQLEQQSTTARSDNTEPGSRSFTKKKPSSGRVRLSGVRPRASKTKPGQKLLKELAGIDANNDVNSSSGGGDKNVPSSALSTIVAGSDEWPSHASRKDFFDPFSTLATMSSNSLSIASSTPSAAQAQRQHQKQQKWMLDEVTQAMRQNINIKRRPLPERPMNSTTGQTDS